MNRPLRIGTWFTEKKRKKLRFEKFDELCEAAGIQVAQMDLFRPLSEQGHFDLILHKVSDELVMAAEMGDTKAKIQMDNFKEYLRQNPNKLVINRLDKITRLRDRLRMFNTLVKSSVIREGGRVFVPPYVELRTKDVRTNKMLLEQAGITYPCVLKPSIADGAEKSHTMAIIFNDKGLEDVEPPCVAQSVIKHGAVLHKLFVIGESQYQVARPSIKNMEPGDFPTVHFRTRDVSKSNSASHLNEVSKENMKELLASTESLEEKYFIKMADSLRDTFGLDLFGADVIVEKDTGRYAVIDVNGFPGYDGVQNFHKLLLDHCIDRVLEHNGLRGSNSVDPGNNLHLKLLKAKRMKEKPFAQGTDRENNGDSQSALYGTGTVISVISVMIVAILVILHFMDLTYGCEPTVGIDSL